MKNLIFTIGLALLTFANANAESNTNGKTGDSKAVNQTLNDTAVAKPETIYANGKTMAEVIAEDRQIIESENETFAPLLPGKSLEETVADDKLVIENTAKEIYPLDFNKINGKKSLAPIKKNHKERLVGSL